MLFATRGAPPSWDPAPRQLLGTVRTAVVLSGRSRPLRERCCADPPSDNRLPHARPAVAAQR